MARRKWGRVSQIKHVKRVLTKSGRPTKAFRSLPSRLKKLAAFRRAHMVSHHSGITEHAHKLGKRSSSAMTSRQMLNYIRQREALRRRLSRIKN